MTIGSVHGLYKGDLAAVTFGKETGIIFSLNDAGADELRCNLTTPSVAGRDQSTIVLFQNAGASTGVFSANTATGMLRLPTGSLVGCKLIIKAADGGNLTADDYEDTGKVFHIVDCAPQTNAIIVSPALTTATQANIGTIGDSILILPYGCPTWNQNCDPDDIGGTIVPDDRFLTDQSVGILNNLTMPNPVQDIRRQHIIGMGRDIVVQTAGKEELTGGTLELMMNNPRWLYYALGGQVVVKESEYGTLDGFNETYNIQRNAGGDPFGATGGAHVSTLTVAAKAGDWWIDVPTAHAALYTFAATEPAMWVLIAHGGALKILPGDEAADYTATQEIRRVIGTRRRSGTITRMFLDEPLKFPHAATVQLTRCDYVTNAPAISVDGVLTNPVWHMLYGETSIPSFSLETSYRRTDTSQNQAGVLNYAGEQQFLRVFSGCKVGDISLSAESEGEVKLSVNFQAQKIFTDTGVSITAAGLTTDYPRFKNPHRPYVTVGEDTAAARSIMGQTDFGEKPFMFYMGELNAFGFQLLRITNFNLTLNNNLISPYYITGTDKIPLTTDQIQHGATHNVGAIVEGKREMELTMTAQITDRKLWDELRLRRDHLQTSGDSDGIRLRFFKPGRAATSAPAGGNAREELLIVCDDYIITESPHQIPDDKGPVIVEVKVFPKHLRIFSSDAIYQY